MLPKAGAYSKRYRAEERETMRHWAATSASRTSRDREHLLSKQTAQRQRALEARKRAMEEAEEERRRRALEERRRTQREATERCKMAISRLRLSSRTSSSTTTNSRQRHMPVEIHYTNLPRQAGADKHKTNRHTSAPPSASAAAGLGERERVVLGTQVELRQDQICAVRRPPALDEVLSSIRGHQTSPKPPPAPALTHSSTTSQPPSVQNRAPQTTPTANEPQVTRSQPNIATHCPIYKVHHASVDHPTKPPKPNTANSSPTSEPKSPPDAEGMVFHPVIRGPLKTRVDLSRDCTTNSMRVVSPTQESSSSCGSPTDSLSGDSSDVDSSTAGPSVKRVVRRHKKIVKKNSERESASNPVTNSSEKVKNEEGSSEVPKSNGNQVYSDNSSSNDESAPPRLSPPRSRRRRKLHPGLNSGGPRYVVEPQEPKIVSILKKPRGASAATHHTDGAKVSDNVSTVSTRSNSTANIVSRMNTVGCAQVSRETVTVSSASTTKRVRFSDTLESSLDSSQSSLRPAHHTNIATETVVEQLWSRLLLDSHQHGVSPDDRVFNPRMKISLTQRGRQRENGGSTQCDRITVHIPQARNQPTRDDIIAREPSPVERQGVWESSGGGDKRNRHTSAETCDRTKSPVLRGEVDSGGAREGEPPLELNPTDPPMGGREWRDVHHTQLRDEERVTVAPQVYQFPPAPQNAGPPTGKGGRYLPHRQQQRPPRGQGVGINHTHQKWAVPDKQLHHRNHVMHSNAYKSTANTSSWEPHMKQGLANYDEQQVMKSLQQIDQRLKEHELAHGATYLPYTPLPHQHHTVTAKATANTRQW